MGQLRVLRWVLLAFLVIPVGLSPFMVTAPVARAAGPDHVSIRTNWLWYGSHSIFFLAKKLGYYQQANLDVDI